MNARDTRIGKAVKAVEDSLRHKAKQRGLRLEKSHSRTPEAASYNTYRLVDATRNTIVLCDASNGYGMCLHDIAEYLKA